MSAAGEAATSRPTRLGRYELITRIGQGGMAEVQLALQRGPAGFEKLVVVKLVHSTLATQKAFVDMLLDEARVAALVKHPNVVDIYDLGQAEGRYFIAMEYLEGEPLLAVLRAGREGKRLDPLSTGRLIADTAEGLDAAHELRSMSGERLELVHHDISLGNIVVLYNGQVKLVDFGVAKATSAASSKSKVQGKFSYMAPEKLRGAAGDRRSDIFSLGCVMWEALTLKRLFRGGNDAETMKQVLEIAIQPPSKINGDVPKEYDAIVMRALERDPDRRHGTAKELAVELEELLRKRGYGAKNDRVAKYMQETFKEHIEARKKLVQEVVAKGSASAEILDAAFSDPGLASGSPVLPISVGGEFSAKVPRVTPGTGVPILNDGAWADSSKPTVISAPVFDPPASEPAKPARAKADAPKPAPPTPGVRSAEPGRPAPRPAPKRPAPPRSERKKPELSTAEVLLPGGPNHDGPTETHPFDPEGSLTEISAHPPDMSEEDPGFASHPSNALDAFPSPVAPPRTLEALASRGRAFADRTRTIAVRARAQLGGVLADPQKRLVAAIGGGLLLLIVVVAIVSGGKDRRGGSTERGIVAHGGGTNREPGSDDTHGGRAGGELGSGELGSNTQQGSDDLGAGLGSDTEHGGRTGSGGDTGELGSGAGSNAGSGSADTGRGSSADTGRGSNAGAGRGSGAGRGGGGPRVDRRPPPIDVEGTVNKALRSFVTGDAKGALGLLLKARAARPGYAPTYRVLGKVYKKLGDLASAKKSFQRYLALSPSAADAEQIREEIKNL